MLSQQSAPGFAYIAVPHLAYGNILQELFFAGVNVIKEKPLAINAAEGFTLIEAANKTGVRLGVSAQRRFSKRYNRLREWLPRVGRVSAVHVIEKIVVSDFTEGWRASKNAAGGGVVLDMGYHMLDQLVGLFGREFREVSARLLKTRSGQYDVEDTAHIHISYAGGIEASVVLSRAGAEQEEILEIIGEHAVLRLNGTKVKFLATGSHDAGNDIFNCEESTNDMLKDLFSSFISGADTDLWNTERDLAVMRLIDAIYSEGKLEQLSSTKSIVGDSSDVPAKKWSWPRLTKEIENDVHKQLHTTLSIYNNGGVFGEFETEIKSAISTPDSNLRVLLHNSGTSALHATFYSLGIGRGDEVIVPVYTFHATISPLMQLGVVPVFVDALTGTGNIDPDGVRAAITKKTKAVVITHMWGIPCDMKQLVQICKEAKIRLVEDCAHAHGATLHGQSVGTFGDGAAWSIQGEKVVTGGEGGVSVTPNEEMYYRQLIHGHYNKRCKTEIPKSHPLHAFSLTGAGLKNRAHPLAISIALNQLRLLPSIHSWKSIYASQIIQALSIVPFIRPPQIDAGASPSWYALVFRFDAQAAPKGLTRERYVDELVRRGLDDVDIPGSTKPLYKEPLYVRPWDVLPHVYEPDAYEPQWSNSDFPGADMFYQSAIKIPVWAYEDDRATIEIYSKIMVQVAYEFIDGFLPIVIE
ncbi:DegT/DnrJ/EryC1/StrS aminotransferase family-domain-containing protein [Phellopilus nigrolimitatus]|nr:DegT/DnrJ/EryC1/StrS aminotransferase family-domain-containing protein [Phellopilus nigrolimitatus]